MADRHNQITRLTALAGRLSHLVSVFSLAWGKTPAYQQLLDGLNDVNAIIASLRNPNQNVTPTGEYSPPR